MGGYLHETGPVLATRDTVIGPLLYLNSGLTCPTLSDNETASGNVSTCPLCDDTADGSGLIIRDDGSSGSCTYMAVDGSTVCLPDADVSTRDLEERVPVTGKYYSWQVVGSQSQTFPDGTYSDALFAGDYPPCASAKKISPIMKYLDFAPDKQPCSNAVSKYAANKVEKRPFATEHVFEPNILKQFFSYLISGSLPVGYSHATNAWVSETLIGFDLGISGALTLSAWPLSDPSNVD
ncbi:hypothetical protein MBLNU459_g8294t1 [Dothideomycetes sp. NU459]